MDVHPRIAVVGPIDDRLTGDLRALPLRPLVRQWATLCGESESLLHFQPAVILVALPPDAGEEIGALRLLRQIWPAVGVVLVTEAAREVVDAPLAQRIGARLLVYPDAPGQLAAAIEQAFHGGSRPRSDLFLDLARGIADEVNNPLMAIGGQLQLLRGNLDPATQKGVRDQVAAALGGVARIQQSVDRLRLVAQAANGPRRPHPVDLAALLATATGERKHGTELAPAITIADGPHTVPGDPEQLAAAVAAVTGFGFDLLALGATVTLALEALPAARRLRLGAIGPGLATWALPATFEPYYPNRALRGQGYGLGLFLAQTVVLGHRGQATARRQPDGGLQLDFVLPV
jgi:signal transduction histidine kinase